ncbi:MAG TPA: TetR/AcrR family transcriptional regulator [Anaerolineae bacterium]|nr:TetR/AcrR family transcriptional regulator [Anaerolineae bacterium]
MPRPRFNKLSPEKRERIMEAAAKEFSACGFEQASLNRILTEAGVSKGAAYYYFDDKADVFSTAIQYYSQDIRTKLGDIPLKSLTAKTFWPTMAKLYQEQFMFVFDRPWAMSLFKAVGKLSLDTVSTNQMLAEIMEQMQSQLLVVLRRGQELGIIRQDLPDDLMLSLFLAIDDAHDRWLLLHREELTPEMLKDTVLPRFIDLFRRFLEPRTE